MTDKQIIKALKAEIEELRSDKIIAETHEFATIMLIGLCMSAYQKKLTTL